jgi:hypothetical protein
MFLKLIKIHKTIRNLDKKTNQKSKNNKRDNTNKKQTYRNHIMNRFKWKKRNEQKSKRRETKTKRNK